MLATHQTPPRPAPGQPQPAPLVSPPSGRATAWSPGRPVRRRPERFTPRESEVLTLLVAGPSNREIAAALKISERTVEAHIAHILGKLGLTNRSQASAWVLRQRLLAAAGAR